MGCVSRALQLAKSVKKVGCQGRRLRMDCEDATFAKQMPVGSRPGMAEDDLISRINRLPIEAALAALKMWEVIWG